MMVWLRFRSVWRRRWASLLAVTLLVGLVGAVTLAAVAGSRRTRSSVGRLDASTQSVDVFALFAGSGFDDADAVLALPQVAEGDRMVLVFTAPPEGYQPFGASVDGRIGTEFARDRILRGRAADPDAADEITMPEPLAERYGLDVGDVFPTVAPTPHQAQCLFDFEYSQSEDCADTEGIFTDDGGADLDRFGGPRVDLRVVGVTRGIGDIQARPDDLQILVLTPGFYREYGDAVFTGPAAVARLKDGVTVDEFEDAVHDVVPDDHLESFNSTGAVVDSLQSTVGVLANGLLAFAAVAAFAGLVAITQVLARQAALDAGDRDVLRAMGATRRVRASDALVPLLPVAFGGMALAVAGAWAVSSLLPIGTARRVEPNPGLQFDGRVLLGGGLLLAIVVLATAGLAAWWVARPATARRARRVPRVATGDVGSTVGIHYAVDPGRGRRAVPVRSAISGTALAVAGIVAVTTFGAGLARFDDEPRRYGYGWDVSVSGERADEEETDDTAKPPDLVLRESAREGARLADDPDVEGVARVWWGFRSRVEGRSVTTYAQETYAGDGALVIVAGRAPREPGEVALGAKTMRRAGVGIGDTVDVDGNRLRVVGRAIFPVTDDGYPLADGALLTADDLLAFGIHQRGNEGWTQYAVQLRDGAGREAAIARLEQLNRDSPVTGTKVPAEVDQLQQLDMLPLYLAGFLLVVALLAVGHALVLTVRRRTGELAVLRTMGCRPRATRATVGWQATTIGALGVLIGVPLGLVLGRFVWAAVARAYGVHDDPAWPWLAVVLVLPVTVLLANVVAWWPGRRAARLRPADALRTE